ncbi:DUF5320 domain-containing protein [Halanaerobium sp. ST460_2HS_T2]|uniref:DUF5320 domain-containing protein n=1 Tax=Halanaerobium sp. ST460_2HS_T2 TaxID=2183914 RepID=UPI000DF31FAD|nr:DUF5320 domain-containing protein [Halanaerobium sp. ST460_2HS_T2]RCW57439.1 hypothetical protein DFR80_11239 [Halanaerobium sp. ST460_2HS_T2]
MPRGDRRGPEGRGPMTGRGLGYCAGNDQPGFAVDAAPQGAGRGFRNGAGRGPGFGRGRGKVRGRGMGYGFAAGRGAVNAPAGKEIDYDSEENKNREITRLENLANTLSSELEIVKKQIEDLKNN